MALGVLSEEELCLVLTIRHARRIEQIEKGHETEYIHEARPLIFLMVDQVSTNGIRSYPAGSSPARLNALRLNALDNDARWLLAARAVSCPAE